MDIRKLSFRLLQVYLQVVRSGSMSAAARQLHLTQPTVSVQMRKLTEAMGQPLLSSRDGILTPTDAGQALYLAALEVTQRFDELAHQLNDLHLGVSGHISIGLVTTAKYVMPKILGAFYRQFPNIQVTLHIGNRAHIVSRFESMQDDLYLFSHPPSGEHVDAKRILRNPLQLIAPPDHWAAGLNRQISFDDIRQERFLMREPGSATRMMFESWLSAQGWQLEQSMQIESNEAIRLSVASGLGLAVTSAHTLEAGRERVAVLDVAQFPLHSHWYLVTQADKRPSAALQQLLGFIAANLHECIAPVWLLPQQPMKNGVTNV
ncbi:LysR family transcriptional regulator [Shewanella sp. NIFS-20-20]|uniref:LysR family transcriptional regulator n=1 Tax=Shewanella sp. NIFS-20-20 TaxID=2853806 RepID=UPI001C461CC2|nr:LysR family transcriptional regulator [Shewanella sp. NIFS-20-20]MBV7314682.1 LysR family transcriptional regulator [Shewanella sp. NIFS-20-20]